MQVVFLPKADTSLLWTLTMCRSRKRLMWQVEFMEKHPEVSTLGSAVECIDAAGKA